MTNGYQYVLNLISIINLCICTKNDSDRRHVLASTSKDIL